MPKPFLQMSRSQFVSSVHHFRWRPAKTEIHVHHTWRPNHAQYQGERSIVAMWEFHTRERGFSDIAQHISIAPDGLIWTGRDWNASPASALNHNHAGLFMFETIGDFDVGKDPLTGEQLETVLLVTAIISQKFGISDSKIRFHNEMSSKSCPGSSVNRAAFLRQVSAKKEEIARSGILEAAPDQEFAALSEELNRRTEDAGAPAQNQENGEHLLDEAQERFMRDFHRNIYSAPALERNAPRSDGGATALHSPSPAEDAIFLQQNDDEALFRELGHRAYKLEALPESALSDGLQDDGTQALEGLGEYFSALGRRIFRRVTREMHGLLCGDRAEDASDRAKLRNAFGLGGDAVVTAIVSVLTSVFGIANPIAAVIAALIAKRLLKPAYEETCSYWGEQLA